MTDDFSIFIKKRNFYLISYCVIEGIFLLFVALAVFIINQMQLDDIKYILSTVLIYFIGAVSGIPLYFKMATYMPVCNIISCSSKLRELFEKRSELIMKAASENQLSITDIKKTLDEFASFQNPVFNSKIIDWDKDITAWFDAHKDKMDKKSYLDIAFKQADIHCLLEQFVRSARRFCNDYDKYIATGKYKAPAIPPMFFDKHDIAVFNEA